MYCISDADYLKDFTMMLNDEIIDCFSEKKPEQGVIKIINEVVNDIVQIKEELVALEKEDEIIKNKNENKIIQNKLKNRQEIFKNIKNNVNLKIRHNISNSNYI